MSAFRIVLAWERPGVARAAVGPAAANARITLTGETRTPSSCLLQGLFLAVTGMSPVVAGVSILV